MEKRTTPAAEPLLETPKKRIKYDEPTFFVLTKEIVDGAIMTDIKKNKWRIGKPLGKGSCGEVFLASNDVKRAVTSTNANYVVKIEAHSSGPLWVEIHCLLNIGRATDESPLPPGVPEYIASGSHTFNNKRYRFLVLPRYKFDLHSVIENSCIDEKKLLVIATQTLDVLQNIHEKGYVHCDIKAANMMFGNCPTERVKEEEKNHCHHKEDDDDSDNKSESINDNSQYSTPMLRSRPAQFSESNSIRSCRMSRKTSMYDEMINDEGDADSKYSQKKINTRKKLCSIPTNTSNGEDRIFLIDFGLALKYVDSNGHHKPFRMDDRRAHDGTIQFTSRDAHMGAHSRRSDLECLGFNLIFWSKGWLPWENEKLLTQPKQVHRVKENFMTDVKEILMGTMVFYVFIQK